MLRELGSGEIRVYEKLFFRKGDSPFEVLNIRKPTIKGRGSFRNLKVSHSIRPAEGLGPIPSRSLHVRKGFLGATTVGEVQSRVRRTRNARNGDRQGDARSFNHPQGGTRTGNPLPSARQVVKKGQYRGGEKGVCARGARETMVKGVGCEKGHPARFAGL